MAQQARITQKGDMVSPAYHQFDANRTVYEYISDRLQKTREAVISAPLEVRAKALRESAEYAIISVQTAVDRHERSFVASRVMDVDESEMADILKENDCVYHNNKARYLVENRENGNFEEMAQLLADGEINKVHDMLTDLLGLASTKAAFTLCMLGFTEKMCLDSNTLNMVDFERRATDKLSTIEYDELAESAMSVFPDLAEEVSPFVWQWVVFDANRGGVELHDVYYARIGDVVNADLL